MTAYVGLHRLLSARGDKAKAAAMAARIVPMMDRLGLDPGARGVTPLNSSLDDLLDPDSFKPLRLASVSP